MFWCTCSALDITNRCNTMVRLGRGWRTSSGRCQRPGRSPRAVCWWAPCTPASPGTSTRSSPSPALATPTTTHPLKRMHQTRRDPISCDKVGQRYETYFDIFILLKSLIILLSLLCMSYVPDVTLWWLLLFQLPLYHDPRLPLGWRRDIQRAPSGECFVVLIHVSSGRTFRNREELRTYLVSSGAAGPDPGKVDFSVFGKVMWPEKHC